MAEKLIRDNIPDFVMQKEGRVLTTRIASPEEKLQFLKNKLVEEANEVLNAPDTKNLVEEIADVLEVLKALTNEINSVDEVFAVRESKYSEKGGFDKGVILIGKC